VHIVFGCRNESEKKSDENEIPALELSQHSQHLTQKRRSKCEAVLDSISECNCNRKSLIGIAFESKHDRKSCSMSLCTRQYAVRIWCFLPLNLKN
jgi:hypothetical protein